MAVTIWGVVKDGVVRPQSPLPEGLRVQIVVEEPAIEVSAELQEEFAAWNRASDKALELVERLATEGQPDETR